jgi:hypothetical protein
MEAEGSQLLVDQAELNTQKEGDWQLLAETSTLKVEDWQLQADQTLLLPPTLVLEGTNFRGLNLYPFGRWAL